MSSDDLAHSPEITLPVAYENGDAGPRNPDFKGSGSLTLRVKDRAYSYRFTGTRHTLFPGRPVECEFRPDEIWNVGTSGTAVSFHTRRGVAGEQGRPFVFYCTNPSDAAAVAALLPKTIDQDSVAVRDFGVRLHSLDGAKSPWTSVTNIIIALNVLAYVAMGLVGAGWLQTESMTPYILYGANNGAATTDGEWWRLITSLFMHYGLLHLALNMWALYQAGHFVEQLQGRSLYALTYLASGVAGGFASILWNGDHAWSAGASGAVFGVYGAIFGYLLREKHGLPASVYQSLLKSSLTFAGYNILFGAARAGTDNSAHIGGVLGGILFGWLVAMPVDRTVREQESRRRLAVGGVAFLGLIAAGVASTPRFNYSAREEFAWENANRPFFEKDQALLSANETALARLTRDGNAAGHSSWLKTNLIPFYRSWDETLASLKLTPGKQTTKQRDKLEKIVRAQAGAYEQLANDLQTGAPDAIARYRRNQQTIGRLVTEFNRQ